MKRKTKLIIKKFKVKHNQNHQEHEKFQVEKNEK